MGSYKRVVKAPLVCSSVMGWELGKILDDREKVVVFDALVNFLPSVAPQDRSPIYPKDLSEREKLVFESIIEPVIPNLEKYWSNNKRQRERRNGQRESDQDSSDGQPVVDRGPTVGQPVVDQINETNKVFSNQGNCDDLLKIYNGPARSWAINQAKAQGQESTLKGLYEEYKNDSDTLKIAIASAYLNRDEDKPVIALIHRYLPDSPF